MVPGFDDGYLHAAIAHTDGLRAVVLELYGTGNISSRKSTLLDALQAAMHRGVLVVASSQCLRGTVDLGAYALGRRLQGIGVISAFDMTTEAICAKLAYLLSWRPALTPAQVSAHMAQSLRGEVTEPLSSMSLPHGPLHVVAASGGDVRISMEHVSSRGQAVASAVPAVSHLTVVPLAGTSAGVPLGSPSGS